MVEEAHVPQAAFGLHGSIFTETNWLWIERIDSFGSFPPYAKILAQTDPSVTGLIFRPDDPKVNAARLTECRNKGLRAGVVFGTAFPSDPIVAAKAVSDTISVLNPDWVLIDGEMHSYEWIFKFVLGDVQNGVARKGYRGSGGQENGQGLRPGKASDWTNESYQDGKWGASESIYPLLIRSRFGVFRQPYGANMEPFDFDSSRDYLVGFGVPLNLARACYDPVRGLPARMAGSVIFYAERWPAMWTASAQLLGKQARAVKKTQRLQDARTAYMNAALAPSASLAPESHDRYDEIAWWERDFAAA